MSSGRLLIDRRLALLVLVLAVFGSRVFGAGDQHGVVTFNGLPVPGATITATQQGKTVVVSTDSEGRYRITGLDDGSYTVRVEMLGFSPLNAESVAGVDVPPASWELALLPFEEIRKIATVSRPVVAEELSPAADPSPAEAEVPADAELERQAAEGFLVNGSVNNAAASPFAQARAFGNNRPGQRALYTGGFGFTFGSSALDARPFSFSSVRSARQDYTDTALTVSVGGPFRIPGVRNRPVFFAGYQRTGDHNASTQSTIVPTAAERAGDFSGSSSVVKDPATGVTFPGNVVPRSRISPQAAALLKLYPLPNVDSDTAFNYEAAAISASTQDNFQSRLNHSLGNRDALLATAMYQRTDTDATSIFGFTDASVTSNRDTAVSWSHRFSQFFSLRTGYQMVRQTSDSTPHFANLSNVSGDAGIEGNDQQPANWGPPTLVFSNGVAGLATGQFSRLDSISHSLSSEALWRTRGGHNVTFGGAVQPKTVDVLGQQNPRGTFSFDGSATGSVLADFLLGVPHSAALAVGNADKRLTARSFNAYVNDDWRVNPAVTVNLGLRWEYESPFSESRGRLVNLDVTPTFSAAIPVVGAEIEPDHSGIQPRLGVALRPIAGSSLVVRGGYGIYRNTNVYQSLALMLAQQPPLSRTVNVEGSEAQPLALATAFTTASDGVSNTFAVDPHFRVSYAHNWQVAVQRDLPLSLTVTATYLGTKGSRLMQEFVPNTYPAGARNPCPTCPSGFVYLVSNGSSLKNAVQLQVRRRLRNGLSALGQYTFSKATDNAPAFTTADLNGAVIAQNWQDLEAEHARSSFDQRHAVTAQVEYSGRGWLRDWTFTSQLSAGSGLPLTPVYLTPLAGTGLTGAVRGSLTGAPVDDAPSGYYVNPAAFIAPVAGEWGTAGRNSITGPAQFSLNAGVTRTFVLGNRWTADWRIDATNVLNRVTYAGINTIVGSPQFGLPNRANQMRKLLSSIRVRF